MATPNYIDKLFEKYILNELGFLNEEEQLKLEDLHLHKAFDREKEPWTETLHNVMQLSETMTTTIWHLWIKNSESYRSKGEELNPVDYAELFIENYYKEGSTLDVWEEDKLEEAKRVIEEYRKVNGI